MTLVRPKCLYCGSNRAMVMSTPKGFIDFQWRHLKCRHCAKRLWWGVSLTADEELLMLKTPKNVDGKTININHALPAGATLKELINKSISVYLQRQANTYLKAKGVNSIAELTADQKRELISMLEYVRGQYLNKGEAA